MLCLRCPGPVARYPAARRSAMALWDKLNGELVDIVEWLDDSRDTMVYRFQRYQNEIKYGAKLVVREVAGGGLRQRGPAGRRVHARHLHAGDAEPADPVDRCRAGSTASTARSRPRSTSSPCAPSPTASGAPRTPSCCATRSSARCGCGPSAPSPSASTTPATFLQQIVGTDGRFSVERDRRAAARHARRALRRRAGREQDPGPGPGEQLRRAGQVHHRPHRARLRRSSA